MPPWRHPFAITIHVYFSVMHVHSHVCICMNIEVCGGTPRHTHTHPPTRGGMAQITKYAIKLERIKIIQFCLKIWDFCTFLHLFRLGLVCRWGVVPSQIAFFTFGPKKVHVFCSCDPLIKMFSIFALDPSRPYLD